MHLMMFALENEADIVVCFSHPGGQITMYACTTYRTAHSVYHKINKVFNVTGRLRIVQQLNVSRQQHCCGLNLVWMKGRITTA